MPTLGQLGEDAVLGLILRRLDIPAHTVVGPGDDAAVSIPTGHLVSTTDMLVEGEDFLRSWFDPRRLGIKAAAQNLADIAAMGADPHGLLVSIAAPPDTQFSVIEDFYAGLTEECRRAGTGVLGGDLSGSSVITVSITALGTLPAAQRPWLRSGAQPGDRVVLAGTVGRAAAGLSLLFAGIREDTAPNDDCAALINGQLAPQPDYATAARLRGWGRAGIDVSDGLCGDLRRVALASHVRIDLDANALIHLAQPLIPAAAALWDLRGGVHEETRHSAESHDSPSSARQDRATPAGTQQAHSPQVPSDRDAFIRAHTGRWVLTGGEDHGILVAGPAGSADVGLMEVASCSSGLPGLYLDGEKITEQAFTHFKENG